MMPGPVPNRTDDLSRARNANRANRPDVIKGVLRETHIPEPDPDWHPIATRIWNGLVNSGQSDFFQDSDWAFLFSVCEDLSAYKKPLITKDGVEYHKRSGQMLQTIYSALERLLVTEGDRRRARIELTAPEPEGPEASVTAINSYRERLGVAS
jgi:hypothetical protein